MFVLGVQEENPFSEGVQEFRRMLYPQLRNYRPLSLFIEP